MIKRNFEAGFSTDNMYKDLTSVIDMAAEYGVSLPATTISWDILRSTKTRGLGAMDSCSVMTVLEELAQVTVKAAD
jgi:3-hydroxyisobutyrate dehydrogenase-like beta-hydroxyacid dehydrogenase